jgi:hypothetical protein
MSAGETASWSWLAVALSLVGVLGLPQGANVEVVVRVP